ncbi:galactokinase family protein [Maridesulfovibrio ferrireducens]|uniref:galactokinase n=1 Tax=Maridesulfovibrio ferrireducens TaxID=246191 RepID=UPI001A2B9E1B|nr:galactokinase family protein [Maridesulfovibrio ferrireducens]MBI9110659.1 galactokinase [Maridesulfovibrio ferrireducens]
MFSIENIRKHLDRGGFDQDFCAIHSYSRLDESRLRLTKLLDWTEESFNSKLSGIASAPGRTEIGGNHTDHNNGRVLAAAVNLDCLSIFSPTSGVDEQVITILSENFEKPIVVDLTDTSPRSKEEGTSEALVRGVADGFRKSGLKASGFNGCVLSSIPAGAGLSSSAAFEVLIGRIFSALFNNSTVSPLDLARIARRAENLYFGKPCGFMDQMASSFEGILRIDFKDSDNPAVERVSPGFINAETGREGFYGTGYRLCVVNTGGSHADLTSEYAAIREEMQLASQFFGRNEARGISMSGVIENMGLLREKAGDRAALRLMHFIGEDERAVLQGNALHAGDIREFLKLVAESGNSSCRLLQNCYNTHSPSEQPIPLALTLTKLLLGSKGVGRVHGGGFAGTIQVYVQDSSFDEYKKAMENVFGAGSVIELVVRQPGREFLSISQTEAEGK